MLEVMLELWNIVLDGLDFLWNTVFSFSDRQIDILMVVGTFAVAVVAAFQDRIRFRLFGPRLGLAGGPDYPPDGDPVPMVDGTEANKRICDGCFVGLPIRNDGPAPAQDVEVMISELERYDNNTFKLDYKFYPLPLYWRHYVPVRVFLERLLPGSVRHIGLGHIPSHFDGRSKGGLPFVINSPMRPTTESHILDPGRYRLTLEISAANSRKPASIRIELSFDGKWRGDNIGGMISVRQLGGS